MNRTVVALYDDFSIANAAVRRLVDQGFSRDDISLIANDTKGEYQRYLTTGTGTVEPASAASEGAAAGAGIGAIIGGLGGLLVGLGALTIPGIGPVLAAGPLAAALTGLAGAGVGAVAGGVTGGLLGALIDLGLPEEQARYYTEGVRRGGALVVVRAADEMMAERARTLLNELDPVDINERASMWREAGWTETDSFTNAYSTDEIERERRNIYQRRYNFDDSFYDYDNTFRTHYYSTYGGSGFGYNTYLPAYHYGYTLANDPRYRDYDWNRLEPEARRDWDRFHPETPWEDFKDSVRYAWDRIRMDA